jgi:hypothetical protein
MTFCRWVPALLLIAAVGGGSLCDIVTSQEHSPSDHPMSSTITGPAAVGPVPASVPSEHATEL